MLSLVKAINLGASSPVFNSVNEERNSMKNSQKRVVYGVLISIIVSSTAYAGGRGGRHSAGIDKEADYKWAKVMDVRKVIETRTEWEPIEECHTRRGRRVHRHSSQSLTPTILGGVIGGALGNGLGHHKSSQKVGAVVGAVLGASIGHDIGGRMGVSHRHSEPVREHRKCSTDFRKREVSEVVGYDVDYKHHGKIFTTFRASRPGKRVKVYYSDLPRRYRHSHKRRKHGGRGRHRHVAHHDHHGRWY